MTGVGLTRSGEIYYFVSVPFYYCYISNTPTSPPHPSHELIQQLSGNQCGSYDHT